MEILVDDRHRLLEAADAVVVREAERLVLVAGVAAADAEDDPPAAHLLHRIHDLGEHAGIAVAGAGDEGAEFDARHARRDGGHQRPAIPEAGGRLLLAARRPVRVQAEFAARVEEVVGEPERVEPHLLRALRERRGCSPTPVCARPARPARAGRRAQPSVAASCLMSWTTIPSFIRDARHEPDRLSGLFRTASIRYHGREGKNRGT